MNDICQEKTTTEPLTMFVEKMPNIRGIITSGIKKKRDGGRGSIRERSELFHKNATALHNGLYDYSKFVYDQNKTKGIIICKKHGEFLQSPNNHLKGQGCPRCVCNRKVFRREEFVEQSAKTHNNLYDYSKFVYYDSHTKGIIICQRHGEFYQIPNKHLNGQGCPKCNLPKGEVIIGKWLAENGIKYEPQKRFDSCINPRTGRKLTFDFFVEGRNILIEFDGPQHFKVGKIGNHFMSSLELKRIQTRDKIKTKFAYTNNITLIRIPYTKFNAINQILERYLICPK